MKNSCHDVSVPALVRAIAMSESAQPNNAAAARNTETYDGVAELRVGLFSFKLTERYV